MQSNPSLLLTGLYEPQEVKRTIRCVVHPFEKHATSQNEYTRYAADMGIILSYYSCLDDWNDEKSKSKRLYAAALKSGCEKAAALYPGKASVIRDRPISSGNCSQKSLTAKRTPGALLFAESVSNWGALSIFWTPTTTWRRMSAQGVSIRSFP